MPSYLFLWSSSLAVCTVLRKQECLLMQIPRLTLKFFVDLGWGSGICPLSKPLPVLSRFCRDCSRGQCVWGGMCSGHHELPETSSVVHETRGSLFFICVFVSSRHGYIWNIFQVDVLSHASHDFGEMLLVLLLSLPSYWEKQNSLSSLRAR